jgi:hypothetical protein
VDSSEDLFGRTVGVDHLDAARLPFCKLEETITDPAMEFNRLVVQPTLAR